MPQKIPIKIKLPSHLSNLPNISNRIITIVIDPKQNISHLLEKIYTILGLPNQSPWFGLATLTKSNFEFNFITLENNGGKKILKFLDQKYLRKFEGSHSSAAVGTAINLANRRGSSSNDSGVQVQAGLYDTPEHILHFCIQNHCPALKYLSSREYDVYSACLRTKLFEFTSPVNYTLTIENMVDLSALSLRLESYDEHDYDDTTSKILSTPNYDIEMIHSDKEIVKNFIQKTFIKNKYSHKNGSQNGLSLPRIQAKLIKICIEEVEFLNYHYYEDEKNKNILGISLTGLFIFNSFGCLKYEFPWEKISKLVVSSNGKKLDIYRDVGYSGNRLYMCDLESERDQSPTRQKKLEKLDKIPEISSSGSYSSFASSTNNFQKSKSNPNLRKNLSIFQSQEKQTITTSNLHAERYEPDQASSKLKKFGNFENLEVISYESKLQHNDSRKGLLNEKLNQTLLRNAEKFRKSGGVGSPLATPKRRGSSVAQKMDERDEQTLKLFNPSAQTSKSLRLKNSKQQNKIDQFGFKRSKTDEKIKALVVLG